jgi:putative thymidine phosphorylase
MELKIKPLKFLAGRPVCMIHKDIAKKLSLHVGKRVKLKKGKKEIISITDIISDGFLKPNQIAVSEIITKKLKLKSGDKVEIELTERPRSINLIKKKLNGEKLEKDEINELIGNIADNSLTEVETAFFVSAVYDNGMDLQETKHLINAMVKSGKQIRVKGKVVDKHSIGGIAGNRTTPLVVAICSSTGLVMPKTSSRAITSAAGTADVIETIAKVDYSIKKIKKIIRKTNACMVWGGALGLAPVDDKIIKIERVVKIDSTAQLLASILSKKISVGSKYILIDIPYGRSAKVNKKRAEELKNKFLKLGEMFNLELDVILTDGREPIGRGVGPVLELKDIFKILRRKDPPKDLEEKSVMLSGRLLELSGKVKKGKGVQLAQRILDSGKAYTQFKKIIKAQEGNLNYLPKPKYQYIIKTKRKIKIKHIDNKLINNLARHAGCPEDKAAGIYLHKKKGEIVEKGKPIMTIYSLSKEKLNYAKKFYNKNKKKIVEIA